MRQPNVRYASACRQVHGYLSLNVREAIRGGATMGDGGKRSLHSSQNCAVGKGGKRSLYSTRIMLNERAPASSHIAVKDQIRPIDHGNLCAWTKESDWKVFRKLREVALERYCERVLKDVRRTVDAPNSTYHERYLKLWELLRTRDKTIAVAFDDSRRSQVIIQLANMIAEDLLSDAEINQFSEDTRERLEGINRLRNS
jgi:hypothetical protein